MFRPLTLKSLILPLLCCYILTTSSPIPPLQDDGNDWNITQVLNTHERLWLYWETESNSFTVSDNDVSLRMNETCIRNQMIHINHTRYDFNVKMLVAGTEFTNTYYGIFDDAISPPKSMSVYDTADPSTPFQQMILGYADPDKFRCIVFFINSLEPTLETEPRDCEMYIPGNRVDDGPSPNCE
ncbi:hypothetical protein MTO96_051776, partial [Rhipicephalus appendiculatus]